MKNPVLTQIRFFDRSIVSCLIIGGFAALVELVDTLA